MGGTGSGGNVVRFPAARATSGRRAKLTVADVEEILRERWQDVVNEPIPGRWLQLLSLFERIEAERSLARRGQAPTARRRPAPSSAFEREAARARQSG